MTGEADRGMTPILLVWDDIFLRSVQDTGRVNIEEGYLLKNLPGKR